MIGETPGVVKAAHFAEQQGAHFAELGRVFGIVGQVGGLALFVLGQKLMRIFFEVKELSFAHAGGGGLVFDEFPIPLLDGAHAGFLAAVIDAVEGIADTGFFAEQHRFEAHAFIGWWWCYAGEVAERGKEVTEVNISGCAATRFNAGAFDDHRHAPGVLVEVLFSLQTVATDGDAVIGRVKNVGVFEFAHFLEPGENATDLDIDVFRTGILASDLVADGGFIATVPDAADGLFIAHIPVSIVERMLGQPVGRERWLELVEGGRVAFIGVIGGSVFG